MDRPIEQAHSLSEMVTLVEQSHFYSLLPKEIPNHEKQLMLAAPCAVAQCLNSSASWMAQPKNEIHLLLLNPSPLDAVDAGLAWGLVSHLLGISGLTPIHLSIVGKQIELASSTANSDELRSITITQYHHSPIEFLIEHPEYRADAAFLMHPQADFSTAGIHAIRELQQRETPLYGTSFSQTEGEQLQHYIEQHEIASLQWLQQNPFALPLEQFTESKAIWADQIWHIAPTLQTNNIDLTIGDLTRQTVLNIIEGGEMVTQQYLKDLDEEQSALTTMLHLLNLLDEQSRSELSAHLFWNLFTQIRQENPAEQHNELLKLIANLGWLGAAEHSTTTSIGEQ